MNEQVLEIMSEILNMTKSEFTSQMDNKNIWDSLTRVEIIFSLEEELDLHFSEKCLAEIVSPGDLYRATLKMGEKK